jgi:transcriptional regulator of acetoin/glycerol metabolism
MSSITFSADVLKARRLFFDEGSTPRGLVDDAVWRSWKRCIDEGRQVHEAAAFNPVQRSVVDELLERNRLLLAAAEPSVMKLADAVSGMGYGVLLTDQAGVGLVVQGPVESGGRLMRMALRRGVDFSERAIGTNAMAAALNEKRAVGVFGAEHFFSQNQVFHCAAAPIFDAYGRIVGSVDITRDSPGRQFDAISLVTECANAIEASLFLQIPAFVIVSLKCYADSERSLRALLSFGRDGEIVAANPAARRLIGLDFTGPLLCYQDLFEGSFADFLAAVKLAHRPLQLQLHSGLKLFADHLPLVPFAPGGAGSANPARQEQRISHSAAPEFGDAGIALSFSKAEKAFAAGLPLLITGETGTGKEVAARALHARSKQGDGPFIAINCAAIPKELIEGELFGYGDGAYTGARKGGAKGKIEHAEGGTLFLDEIGDMPLELQTRLLRVLENREVTRLGEASAKRVDFRFISATHQDLAQLVAEQRFRQDLYFRIAGVSLHLPPLRLRDNVKALIDKIVDEEGIAARRISLEVRERLVSHLWPGNTRELRHALRFANAMAGADVLIGLEHLPDTLLNNQKDTAVRQAARYAPMTTAPVGQLKALEFEVMNRALQETGGNISRAAKKMGISRSTLHRWIKAGAMNESP